MKDGGFSLVLYCGGYTYNNMIMCSGTRNVLIDFSKYSKEDIAKVLDFIDFSCGLFDKPVYDWNKIINIVSILRDRFKIINDTLWYGLYSWAPLHKKCNAGLRLMFNNDLMKEEGDGSENILVHVKRL